MMILTYQGNSAVAFLSNKTEQDGFWCQCIFYVSTDGWEAKSDYIPLWRMPLMFISCPLLHIIQMHFWKKGNMLNCTFLYFIANMHAQMQPDVFCMSGVVDDRSAWWLIMDVQTYESRCCKHENTYCLGAITIYFFRKPLQIMMSHSCKTPPPTTSSSKKASAALVMIDCIIHFHIFPQDY